jgi:hypothetical protein
MVEGDHHRAHPRYVEERSEESLCSILHACGRSRLSSPSDDEHLPGLEAPS